jgi:hypothetical protein
MFGPDYGRLVFERFAFMLVFVVGRFAFAFVFVLATGVLVGIGVGVDTLVFRFMLALLAVLLVAASPQAIPNEPSANTAVSAIFFIILD